METKKRHISDDSEASLPKKRALVDARGSPTPHVNGLVSDAPDEPKDDNVESFRKEAIYRRMQHYSRECERSRTQVAELERWRRNCEAGLAALEACWSQLLDTTRSLMGSADHPAQDITAHDLFDLTAHAGDSDSVLADALRRKADATKAMLTSIVQRGAPALLQDPLFAKCEAAQAECNVLRSEMAVVRARLARAEEDSHRLRADLAAAENRTARMNSPSVARMNGAAPTPSVPAPNDVATAADVEPKPEPGVAPLPPVPSASPAPAVGASFDALAELRQEKIRQLDKQVKAYMLSNKALAFERDHPPESAILGTEHYQAVVQRLAKAEAEARESAETLSVSERELSELREARDKAASTSAAELAKVIQEYKAKLEKRDGDLARLRQQRDQQQAELNERKAKDDGSNLAVGQMKDLANSREQRVSVLHSEVTRLKTALAANAGDEQLMRIILDNKDADLTLVEDLRRRLAESDARLQAFRQVLEKLDQSSPDTAQHARAEAEARQQLADATKELDRWRATFGDAADLPPDAAQLAKQLRAKEDELAKARLQVAQHSQAEAALYTELDKLSAAWEALDQQVKNKVFELKAMEDRVTKTGVEKAKSDNKYFAAMRQKEASDNERKNLSRTVEKQTKAVERLTASEAKLQEQIAALEKQEAVFQRSVRTFEARLAEQTRESHEWRTRAENERQRYQHASRSTCPMCEKLHGREAELQQLREEVLRAKADAERAAVKARPPPPPPLAAASSREAHLQGEINKCMSILKCSTCKMRMRSTVITKCMHSFCKECVDARISTRQRKCPACNLAFAQSDVQTLYFQ